LELGTIAGRGRNLLLEYSPTSCLLKSLELKVQVLLKSGHSRVPDLHVRTHLLEMMETIRGAGGKFQSLSEPWADTTSHAGKMTIFAGIAEFERDLIRERTGAGREAAKKRGASVFNVHAATIYRLAAS
jgi:hypothetical protein